MRLVADNRMAVYSGDDCFIEVMPRVISGEDIVMVLFSGSYKGSEELVGRIVDSIIKDGFYSSDERFGDLKSVIEDYGDNADEFGLSIAAERVVDVPPVYLLHVRIVDYRKMLKRARIISRSDDPESRLENLSIALHDLRNK